MASKIKEKARVVAMDLRGHGKSVSENELDLSLEVYNITLKKKIKDWIFASTIHSVVFGN